MKGTSEACFFFALIRITAVASIWPPNSTFFVNLTVAGESHKITLSGKPSEQFMVNLHCVPECNTSWYRYSNDHQSIEIEKKHSFQYIAPKFIITEDARESKLQINHIDLKDFSTYEIKVSNGYTEERRKFSLIVHAAPKVLRKEYHTISHAFVNTTTKIICAAKGFPTPQIKWTMRYCEARPCFTNITLPLPISINYNVSQLNATDVVSTLTFKSINTTVLRCEAQNYLGSSDNAWAIMVSDYGFHVRVKLENHSEVIVVGEDIKITCAAVKRRFKSNLTWKYTKISSHFRDWPVIITPSQEFQIQDSETAYSYLSTLLISNAQVHHSRKYHCEAGEKPDSRFVESDVVDVIVHEIIAPRILYSNMNNGVWTVLPGAAVYITIVVEGIPTPSIHWYKDKEPLSINDRIILSNGSGNSTKVDRNLTIINVSGADEGIYSFVAVNKGGNQSQSLTLSIITVSSEDSKNIAGGVAVLLASLLAGIILRYIIKQMKKKKELREMLRRYGLHQRRNNEMPELDPNRDLDEQIINIPYRREYEFPKERLKYGEVLGSGAFGTVRKAIAEGLLKKKEVTTVAIKLSKSSDEINIQYLITELKILIYVGRHPHIVSLLGACTADIKNGDLAIILEYCPYGSILEFLRQRAKFYNQIKSETSGRSQVHLTSDDSFEPKCTSCDSNDDFGALSIKTIDLVKWSYQVALGMEYLASRKVLHGDLAARNVLLGEGKTAKICDFGLAKSMYRGEQYQRSKTRLPVKWMAIESLKNRVFSSQTDVWSFAVVLWEFFSLGMMPYPDLECWQDLLIKLEAGHRLEKPEFATTDIYEMMMMCWHKDPNSRPTFTELSASLSRLYAECDHPPFSPSMQHYNRNKREPVTSTSSLAISIDAEYIEMKPMTSTAH